MKRIAQSQEDESKTKVLGGTSQARLFTYPSGEKLVVKNQNRRDNDADELGALVGDSIGLHTPATHREGDRIYMEYMPGRTGVQTDWPANQDAILDSPDGRLMGLLDLLLINPDRSTSNWIQRDDGGLTAIDHGYGWDMSNVSSAWGSPFARRHFMKPITGGAALRAHDMPRSELQAIRTRLAGLKSDFVKRGRLDWWTVMMERMDMVIEQAKS